MASVTGSSSGGTVGVKPSVRRAYRAVLQYIHSNRLTTGSRLPSQHVLREKLRFGNDTLGEAMQLLVANGHLTRQRKVGTVVSDPHRPSRGLWSVALTQSEVDHGFFGILSHHLRRHLAKDGCEDCTFLRVGVPRNRPHRLSDFPGLVETIKAGLVDVVITPEHLVTSEVLVYHLSGGPGVRFGMELDMESFMGQACRELVARGCRRIGLVGYKVSEYLGQYLWAQMEEALARACRGGPSWEMVARRDPSIAGGVQVAETLLRRPPKRRPDALILTDDYAVMGLTDRLREESEYRPRIVGLTNRQAPLLFALPVTRVEIDIEDVAERAVSMVMARLLNPREPLRVRQYRVRLGAEVEGGSRSPGS